MASVIMPNVYADCGHNAYYHHPMCNYVSGIITGGIMSSGIMLSGIIPVIITPSVTNTCHYAACHNTKCHYAKCHAPSVAMLGGTMTSVIMPNAAEPITIFFSESSECRNPRTPP